MTAAENIQTGYIGLQTGILCVTAIFTLVFAYISGLHLFLKDEPLLTRAGTYIVFLGAFLFLHLFLFSISVIGASWLHTMNAVNLEGPQNTYVSLVTALMRWSWGLVALATLVFTTIETFRPRD